MKVRILFFAIVICMFISASAQTLKPSISSYIISNNCASYGQSLSVIIKGSHFTGTNIVSTGSIPALSFTVLDDSTINAVIRNNAAGIIVVATVSGYASSLTPLVINGLLSLAYIPNVGARQLSVIDLKSYAIIATIPVGWYPQGICSSPDGKRVYVANALDNTVSVVNTTDNTVLATIPVSVEPFGMCVSKDGNTLYVANLVQSTISVINTATNKITSTLKCPNPYGISLNPDGTKIYVPNKNDSTVNVFNTSTNSLINTLKVGINPYSVGFTPDGNKAYVTNFGSNNVTVLDAKSDTFITTIPVGNGPFGICVTPDGKKAYVSNKRNASVSVINTEADTILSSISVGISPDGISVSSDGRQVLVTNYDVWYISFIDTKLDSQVKTVSINTLPSSLGNFIVNVASLIPSANINLISCNSITYNGLKYNTSTSFIDTVKSYYGCDSVYKHVNIVIKYINPFTKTANISNCHSVTFNGITYTKSVIIRDTVKSYYGCDSIYNVTNINVSSCLIPSLYLDRKYISPCTPTIDISLWGKTLYNITKLTGTISWDTTLLGYEKTSVTNNIGFTTLNINSSNAMNGKLGYNWNDSIAYNIADSAPIFSITFYTKPNTGGTLIQFDNSLYQLETDTAIGSASKKCSYNMGYIVFNDTPKIVQINEHTLQCLAGCGPIHYQWYLNGIAISGDTLSMITIDSSGDYSVEVSYARGFSSKSVLKRIILPVTILSFNVQQLKLFNALYWVTSTEINTSLFNIQRSKDGRIFTTIGNVHAKGIGTYSFNDLLLNKFTKDILYYRLEVVDKDGSKKYSVVKEMSTDNEKSAIVVWPNPTKGNVTVEGISIKSIRIIDNTGRMVFLKNNATPVSNATIDTKSLANGIYFIQIIQSNGTLKTQKLVKD